MKRFMLALLLFLLFIGKGWSDEPVTSDRIPSPQKEHAGLWARAFLEAPLWQSFNPKGADSEAVRMLLAMKNGERLSNGVGWFGPSQRRYNWSWLSRQFDKNGDGSILPKEFRLRKELYLKLDRNGDGEVTEEDLDWSASSDWVRRDKDALKLFRMVDTDGNGRGSEAEWMAFYQKIKQAKGDLTPDVLREILDGPRSKSSGKKVSKEVWMRALVAGDLGSAFPGPALNATAPDFTLPLSSGQATVTLSKLYKEKPVVLIFGSFT